MLKSAAKMDHARTCGTLLNMKFLPDALKDENGIQKLAGLIRTYFPTLSKKPQKSHQKGMELPDPCRYFLRKLCGVLVAYFILS